jgi:hypothetical protein
MSFKFNGDALGKIIGGVSGAVQDDLKNVKMDK